jgi:hypothetical protein
LKDVRIEEIGFIDNFETKIIEESSSFFDHPFFCITLIYSAITAALFEAIGGMYMPVNLSTNLLRRRRNSLNRRRMLNSPWGSLPEIR